MQDKTLRAVIKLKDEMSGPLKAINSVLRGTQISTDKNKKSINDYKKEIKLTQKELSSVKTEMVETSRKMLTLSQAIDRGEDSTGELKKELDQAQKSMAELRQRSSELGNSLENQTSKMNQQKKKLEELSNTARAAGMVLAGLGTGAIAYTSKKAIEFESAFAGVKKTINATPAELEKISMGLIEMSNSMPQSASELSSIAETAGQLGIQKENILAFTKTMAMLGDTTNLTSEEVATAFAQIANVTGMPQSEFDKLGSTIVALGNAGASTEADIVGIMNRIASSSAIVGMSVSQSASWASAMASLGITAEAGGTSFNRTLSDMQLAIETNSKSLPKFAKVAGMSAEEFKKAFKDDASGALLKFTQGLGSAEKNGTSMIAILDDLGITGAEQSLLLKKLAGGTKTVSDSLKVGDKAWKDNNALQKEAAERYKTTASQLKTIKNQLVNASIVIGSSFLPIIKDVANKVSEITMAFSGLDPNLQKNVAMFILISTACGFVLLAIGLLYPVFVGIGVVLGVLASALGIVAGVLTFLCSPIGLAIAGLLLLQLAFIWVKEKGIKSFSDLKTEVTKAIQGIIDFWSGFIAIIKSPVKAVVDIAKNVKENKTSNSKDGKRSAYGTKRVHGNDINYKLHDGEKILTRQEADRYEKGNGISGGINITINGMTVREEADIDRVARALVKKIKIAKISYGGAY